MTDTAIPKWLERIKKGKRMGYTTEFQGEFECQPALTGEHRDYLEKFRYTRRMKRDPEVAESMPDAEREAVGLPIGTDGEFFVGSEGEFGQDNDQSVLEYNRPPTTQPGLWCQWAPNEQGTAISWDGGEKFYHYIEWLRYQIDNFFAPWGYKLNGVVTWQGESHGDVGSIVVTDNQIEIQ
jgi:hypothetical protein